MNEAIDELYPVFWYDPECNPIPKSQFISVSLKKTDFEYAPLYDRYAIKIAFEAGRRQGMKESNRERD
jgi:hypothetical protein